MSVKRQKQYNVTIERVTIIIIIIDRVYIYRRQQVCRVFLPCSARPGPTIATASRRNAVARLRRRRRDSCMSACAIVSTVAVAVRGSDGATSSSSLTRLFFAADTKTKKTQNYILIQITLSIFFKHDYLLTP